jgi:hypothetical protein
MASQDFLVRALDGVIGSVCLHDWDRGMGVAGGIFLPNENYNPQLHASEVSGVEHHLPAKRPSLAIIGEGGVEPSFEQIHLADWSSEAGVEGRELTVFGIDIVGVFGPDYSVEE